MAGRFPGRSRSVVTGSTGTRCDVAMTESRGQPGSGLVATVARSGGRNVAAGLASGRRAVVAG